MAEPQHFAEDGSETWSVHRASQSPSQLSQTQVNLMILSVFCSSFFLNFLVGGDGQVERGGGFGEWMVGLILLLVGLIWIVLLYKVRECAVWPEEVLFRRDGLVVMELGCGYRALNSADGGITMYRKNIQWFDGLGVWCNAVTDRTRDDIFILVPSEGPVYWKGFAFQPEDPGAFIHDCTHAGIIYHDEIGGGEELVMVESTQEQQQQESLLRNVYHEIRDIEQQFYTNYDNDDVDIYQSQNEEDILPEHDDEYDETKEILGLLKNNNNIVEE